MLAIHLQEVIKNLILREGGGAYVDHPNDKGGPTRWGVTEAVARADGYEGDMRNYPRKSAESLYLRKYWKKPGFEAISFVSPLIAEEMLDTGVNMHPIWPSKFLQRALNTLNQRASKYPDLMVDGMVGDMTVYALRSFLKWRGKDGETVILRLLDSQQGVRYMEITEGNQTQEDFMFGWALNRLGVAHG